MPLLALGKIMPSLSPLTHPTFRRLFAAQLIALIGTGLSTVALTLLAYDMAGGDAAAVLGTALAFKMVAYVFFAPIIGGLAHRFPRKSFLILMDWLRAMVVLLIPWVNQTWQIFLLIFLLNLFSAGFKPVFSATIPDLFRDEKQYTKALSYTRLAYDLESLVSPVLAGLALLFFSYSALFISNSVAFFISSLLIAISLIPKAPTVARAGKIWDEISFGIRAYSKTPRLRGLFVLYLAVAAASAMVIVNTVVYVRENLAGTETDVAIALSAAGLGSMLGALILPRVLNQISDRNVMLFGAILMAIGVLFISTSPSFVAVLFIWTSIGFGWSLVQTPSGRVINRSSSAGDRTAYFSAQFSLSHACWLAFYLIAGFLGNYFGVETTALVLSLAIIIFTLVAANLWAKNDSAVIEHEHPEETHEHLHYHDKHHSHEHQGWEGPEPHRHPHYHPHTKHAHTYVIDDHHRSWPD